MPSEAIFDPNVFRAEDFSATVTEVWPPDEPEIPIAPETTIIRSDQNWLVTVKWRNLGTGTGIITGDWHLHVVAECLGPGDEAIRVGLVGLGEHSFPLSPGPEPRIYEHTFEIAAGILPVVGSYGVTLYKLITSLTYIHDTGTPGEKAAYVEGPILQIYKPQSAYPEGSILGVVESIDDIHEITFVTDEGTLMTPSFLAKVIIPFLCAVADIQQIFDKIQQRDTTEVIVKSISQHSPVSVSLEGGADAVKVVLDLVVPWRRKYVKEMAQLEQEEKLAKIADLRAETNERQAHAYKERAEARKIETDRAKLVLDMLEEFGPALSEEQKILYAMQLIGPLGVLTESPIQITASKSGEH